MNNTRVFSLLVVLASVSLASTGPIEGLHPRITVDGAAEVRFAEGAVYVASTGVVSFVRMSWNRRMSGGTLVLNDAWERSYGDIGWRDLSAKRFSPWYFLAQTEDGSTSGIGVETGPGAMCCWEVSTDGGTVVYEWNITESE